jgi:aminobenzoyl-glutamate utilization protein B
VFSGGPALIAQRGAPDDRASLIQSIEAKRESYATVAKQIWGFAEVGYQEQKSSALLQQQLRAAGFQVKAGVADIPTAFVATFGSGKPIIGIVGEFDALPGLSQEAQTRSGTRSKRTRPDTAAATTCSAPARWRRRWP